MDTLPKQNCWSVAPRSTSVSWSDALDEMCHRRRLCKVDRPNASGSGCMCGFGLLQRSNRLGVLGDFARKSDFAVGALACSLQAEGFFDGWYWRRAHTRPWVVGLALATKTNPQGHVGVVIDGACRDLDEIRRL